MSFQSRRKQIAFGLAGFIAGIIVALVAVHIEHWMEMGFHTGGWDPEYLANYTPKNWTTVSVFGIEIWDGPDNADADAHSRMVWMACAFCIAMIGAVAGVLIAKFKRPIPDPR